MSGGGGFRGRGYGPHGHRHQGPRPDLSGGSGCRGGSGGRYSGPRQDGPGQRPSGPNLRPDGPNSRLGGPNFNPRGGGPPRGTCPNFNPSRHPPRHPNRPNDNWSPRGGSPQYQSWRGARQQRFNAPSRPFYRGRGQGQYMPRFPFVPTGNFPPQYLTYPPVQEPKPVEQKPAIPHLGSEEERQQKITEAADALKRKLSAVAKEPDEWRDDEDDEGLVESSRDTDHDSRIANKGIPELKHDPPELNLTLNDLRDIGRVDHEYRTEQSKANPEIDQNYEFDESEVKILAHNPVKPMIEIDLWSDDNYGEYAEDESGNRTTEEMGISSHMQDTSQNHHSDSFSVTCGFQSFNDSCTFGPPEDYVQEPRSNENIDESTHQEITMMENVIDQQNETVSECNTKEVNTEQQIDANRSDRYDKVHGETVNDSSVDKTDAEVMVATIVPRDEISTSNGAGTEEFQSEATSEASEQRDPENQYKERATVSDNLDNFNVTQTTKDVEGESQETEDENNIGKLGENWVELSNTQDDNTRIPGLDSLYQNEITAQSSEESTSCGNVESAINESEIEQNNISGPRSEVEPAIVKKEIKESRKEVTSENLDKTLIDGSEVSIKSDRRVRNENETEKDDRSRETRHETSKDTRSEKKERPCSGSSDKPTDEAKPVEDSSKPDKIVDERNADKQQPSLNDQKNLERKRLVRKMTETSETPRTRSRGALVSKVPANFDPREPPPIPFDKSLFSKPPPSIPQANQDSSDTPHVPPAFDPRLSVSDRNALLPTGPSISSAIPVAQDFVYPPRTITNFPPIVPAINYGPTPMIMPTNVESTANIPPMCLGDPYAPLLPLPNVTVTTPINIPVDNPLLLPPLPIQPPPPLPSSGKSNIDMDDGLEDMQEAMEFAKQLMNMDESTEMADEINSIDSDFFHMPTFPDLPPIELPAFLPSEIPTPPEAKRVSIHRQTKSNKESKRSKSSKQETDLYGPEPMPEELRKKENSVNETGEEKLNIADEERPKVMFNFSSKSKMINKDNEWMQHQNREEAAEAASIYRCSSLIPAITPATENVRLPNGQDDRKKSQKVPEKIDSKSSKITPNHSQNKKPEELPSHSRSRSPSPVKSKQTKLPKSANTTDSEILPRKITKESTARKSSDETPESSWKSRVIGRFLKMSKNDIGNMLNNTGLRKFDIAMKHLVKERTSSLSFNMRKKEEEKLKDPEASYNREEFMDQLSAMLDPSATVDVCNLPTQFLHHLSEVLQLESMSELGEPFTPLENVEVPAASPTQQVAQQSTRLSRENANAKEIDDRRSSKRGREKKSTTASCAVETSVATPPTPTAEVRRTLRPAEDSVVPKCVVKKENIVEEVQKPPAMALTRTRRRVHRSGITDQPETSTTAINGSTSRENPNSLNMAVLDDLFSEGIAKAKKKATQSTKNDKNTGSSENEVHSGCNQAEKYDAIAKDPSVDRVERAAVELDKIFTAGIAKAKLASRKVAAAAARAAEANDGDDDEEDAGWRYNDDNRSHSHNNRGRHRSFSRHIGRCEKWSRRKAREDPDTFRNLTKEEWEAKYGETSDSTYEREYRAMVAMHSRRIVHSPTYYRDDYEGFGEENIGGGGGNVMSRLGNIVAGGSGLNEPWSESEEDRRVRNSFDNADYTVESYNNSSEDNTTSSSTSGSSTETSQTESPEVPSVTKLLKVIKAREKIGKKRSLNEEIRDEVNADIERKRRERGKVSRKGHKSRTKKSHRRKKDKKVREKKKRLRKRKKRKSRRSGSEDENSGDEYSDEEGTSSRKQGQLLTQEEIKKENDDVVVVKDEPECDTVQPAVEKKQTKSVVPVKEVDDSRSSSITTTPSKSTSVGASAATISPSQMKTKAQLKQLPPDLLNKTVAVAEISKETPKKQAMPVKVLPKENPGKLSEPSSSPQSINATSSVQKNSPAIMNTENLLSKTHSKKLDFNAYKERTRLRMLRENEKIRLISENPSSLTQNLLNIPLSRKKVVDETNEAVDQLVDQCKDPRLTKKVQLPSTTISDTALCPTTSKIATSTMVTKGSAISTATATVTSTKTSTIAKTSETSTTDVRTSDISATKVKPSATSTTTDKTAAIKTTSTKPLALSTTTTKPSALSTTTAKPSALSTTTAKPSALSTTTAKPSAVSTTTAKSTTIDTTTDKISSVNTTTTDKISSINTTTTDKTSSINTTATDKTSSINTTVSDKTSSINATATDKTSSINTTTSVIPSIVDPVKVPTSESATVQQPSSKKAPVKKLIRRRSVTKTPESESTLIEARAEAGKFAHIKSEGSKEMKLREKLKKGRQRVSSEGLETTIPLIQKTRSKKRPSSLVRNAEEPASFPVKQKINEVPVKRKFDYFKKGPVSDLLPDTVPQELIPVFRNITTKIDDILDQPEIDPLVMPIAELSAWPLESSMSTNITDDIDTNTSPPFKGFPAEPILRRDRVLTEAELNSEIDALEAVSLAFEGGADALPMSTVVDLNDLRSTGLPLNEPISYGDEEFVEGRDEIDTTLLGFSVTNDIPDDPEAVAALGDDVFVAQNVEQSLEKFPEESRESIDILPRVTSTLNDSPAPVDFLIAEVQRSESIPSPLLVTESLREDNEESLATDFSNNHIEEKKQTADTSCDDVAEVTSSHESHINATSDVYLETIGLDSETSSSRVTSNAEDKDISFRTEIANDKTENASEAQEMQEKRTFLEDRSTKDVPSTNSTLEMIHTPPPQPSSSSDSTEERGKEPAVENQRDASETRDTETKTKETSHHSHSKSRDHLHGKSKRKSGRHHNHESKSKKKGAITEKIVKEAVVANIVKLVPKPTNKETVMARMIEIDVEIHKLMNEKMTLYKMLESGEFPVKEDGTEASSAKTNSEPKVTSETDEIRETVPPTVLASRLVRDLDKTVIPTPAIVHDNSRKSDGRKGEAEDEGKKSKRKRSPQQEAKNRTKDNSTVESRRQRKISESKSHSRRTTSEESSRHDTTSTHSREKSTSSTELEDAEDKNLKRKSKSLQRRSPNRRSSKRSRENSSKEDLREGSRESTDRSAKSKKQDTRNSFEENPVSKIKKKMKNLDAKKSEEKGKMQKEEKKTSVNSKVTEKNEIGDKKTIGDGERGVIYSDESTWDSLEPEAIQGDEQRGKKDSAPTTGLALLEESFKREIAETRKLKTIEKRKGKKQELRRILLESSALTPEEENSLKKESLTLGKGKDKFGNMSGDTVKVMKHITTVIDAVAENRVDQLYNDDTSSEPRDTFSDSSPIRDTATEEKEEENLPEKVAEATKTAVVDKDEPEKPDDSESIAEPVQEEKTVEEETTEVSDAKKSSGNEDPQENLEHNISNDGNTKKSSEIDARVEESSNNVEHENSTEKNIDEQQSSVRTSADVPAGKEEDREDQIQENQSSTNLRKSESFADQEKEVNDKTIKPSPSPDVTDATSKTTAEVEGNRKTQAQLKNQISEKESLKGSRDSLEKSSESSKERRNAKDTESERVRSKSRNGRSGKQRNVVIRDASSKERKSLHTDKHNSSKAEDSKDDAEKSSTRPKSATKRRQREKSTPPNRRSSRYPEDGGKISRSKKREKSTSRGPSPYEGEPARKKSNHSRRLSSPLVQVPHNEDHNRRRSRKRKRRPEISREEMASCKVLLIDCKYTYLSPSMHPRILRKLGIAKINPYTPPTIVPETPASPKISRVETHSPSDFSKVDLSEVPEESPKESGASLMELESAKERPSSPSDRPSSPKERSSSPKERSSSPKERSSSPKERSSSPKERPSSSLPKERSSSPKENPSSPLPEERFSPPPSEDSPSSPIELPVHRSSKPIISSPDRNPSSPQIKPESPSEISNRVEVDEDDDEDDVFDETIQIIKAADENLPLTSQSEDEEVEGVVDVIEETEDVADVPDEAVDGVEEDADVAEEETAVAEEEADVAEEEADVAEEEVHVAEEEVHVAEDEVHVDEEEAHVAEEEEMDVMDVAEEAADVTDVTEEPAAPPDSTADDIIVDDDNEDNSINENIQEADTTDEIQLLEENITIVDKPAEIHELAESEGEDEDVEPRRTRYTVHKGPILDIKVLDDSFLAASEDGAIYRYSQQSNGILNIYKGHEAAVTCIYVLRTIGKCWKLYSGSLDGSFRCYDITTGLQERPPADVGSPVQCMDQAWGVFFVGTKSGYISRYNIKSGSIKGDRLKFSDKSVLALKASSEGPRRVLIVASRNQPITIRDALTGLFLRIICGYKNHTVYSLMRERNLVYCGTSSTSIPVFDFTNGEQITQYNAGVGIVCMRLYRQILFAGCYDGNIYVFDTKETKLICSIPGPGNMLLSMEIVGDEIIAGSKNRQLHSWRMPRQVRILLAQRT